MDHALLFHFNARHGADKKTGCVGVVRQGTSLIAAPMQVQTCFADKKHTVVRGVPKAAFSQVAFVQGIDAVFYIFCFLACEYRPVVRVLGALHR